MRILLAEDEVELSNALCAILKHNNYSVDAVYNGADALDYLSADNYDAAILDVMMPKMDGLTVLRKARAQGIGIPVLVLTAKAEIDDRVSGLDAGADDYLTKPFAAKELLARLRAITRRQTENQTTELRFADLVLDLAGFDLKGPSGSLKLANKEFQMLEMLMRTPGRVIATETFMDHIWGYDSESELNVVWVSLSNLRKKLSSVGSSARIQVQRGQGYFLADTGK